MERLAGLDASFLYAETPTLHMHVAGLVLFDPSSMAGGYSFQRLVEHMRVRFGQLPQCRRRVKAMPLGMDHPVWVEDPDFDFDDHLHRIAAPPPGGSRELAEVVGEIAGLQLDRSRPLWEVWVIEGLEHDRVALVVKMHHAAVDGVSGAGLMTHLFDLEPGALEPAPVASSPGKAAPSTLELVREALHHRLGGPLRAARVLAKTGRSLIDLLGVAEATPGRKGEATPALPFTAPRTRFNGSIGRRRSVAFGKASLEDVKFVKSVLGGTVNDVVLAACSMALRGYLACHDRVPEKPLVASVPVSVRGQDGDAGSANQVSAMFVRLPTHLEDPTEVLAAIRAETGSAKQAHEALGGSMLRQWVEFVSPGLFTQAARAYSRWKLADHHRPIHNLVVSNVPGPPFPLYLAGGRVLATYPLGPILEGAGINITVLSYTGSLDFGVIACRKSVPEVWDLASGFGQAVFELVKAAEEKAASDA